VGELVSPARKQRVYRRPDPTVATGEFREYRHRISCFHLWKTNTDGEICTVCSATCKRDPQGRIVEYSTLAERELEEQERAEARAAMAS